MTDPLVGASVGHYEVLARLGGGGMGVVYKARDSRLGRFVALKFLPAQWSHDEGAKARFMREAQAASATEHPNICTIYSIEDAPDGQLFIVMAYYDGITLKDRLAHGPLPVDESLEIATQLAQGLARAHRAGVVHRDVKPSNLILTDDAVKILDFGLAKFADAQQITVVASAPIGTYAYMSPEQVRAQDATPQSDVWALGVVLYEMLAGRPPFAGSYFEAIAHAIRHETPTPLRSVRPEVPDAVERLVFRALHKDAAVRFTDGRDLALALLHVRGMSAPLDLRSGVVEVPRHLLTHPPRPPARRWPIVALGLALVGALAGLLVWGRGAPVVGPRDTVVVAPVLNQSGYPELDPFRLALTLALATELQPSRYVRPVDEGRVAMLARDVARKGLDPSGPDMLQRVTSAGHARWAVLPTILHERGAWSARAEIRDLQTGATLTQVTTDGVASSLNKETAYSRIAALARAVDAAFATRRGAAPSPERPTSSRVRSLEAVQAVEEGLAAMEQLNPARARDAFARAAALDQRHPTPLVWLSKAELALRRTNEAAEAADRATRLLNAGTLPSDSLLAQAVAATVRNDPAEARARYEELVRQFPDDARWRIELAADHDGQGRVDDAIQEYQRIAVDERSPRVAVELCRLYARRDDRPRAREQARRAADEFSGMGAPLGVAQAQLCDADVLRRGTPEEKRAGLAASLDALGIFDAQQDAFNSARAHHYVALALVSEGREPEAVASWERALAGARSTGNAVLEAGTLNNLGLATLALGRRRESLRYLEDAATANERIGDERQTAGAQVNSATILVQFGPDADEGLRRVQSALTVFRKIGDRTGELFAHRVSGEYYRNAGRFADADMAFEQALAIAGERGLRDDTLGIWVEMAIGQMAVGDYGRARELLEAVVGDSSNRDVTRATILRGVAQRRLGDFDAAERSFAAAWAAMQRAGDVRFESLLLVSEAQLALERGDRSRARALFDRAAKIQGNDLADDHALAAAAFGHALGAGPPAARIAAIESLRVGTEKLGRIDLSALLRVLLAGVALDGGLADRAAEYLRVEAEEERRWDRELAAQAMLLRSRARAALGDRPGGEATRAAAGRMLEELRSHIPPQDRAAFDKRPFVAQLSQAAR